MAEASVNSSEDVSELERSRKWREGGQARVAHSNCRQERHRNEVPRHQQKVNNYVSRGRIDEHQNYGSGYNPQSARNVKKSNRESGSRRVDQKYGRNTESEPRTLDAYERRGHFERPSEGSRPQETYSRNSGNSQRGKNSGRTGRYDHMPGISNSHSWSSYQCGLDSMPEVFMDGSYDSQAHSHWQYPPHYHINDRHVNSLGRGWHDRPMSSDHRPTSSQRNSKYYDNRHRWANSHNSHARGSNQSRQKQIPSESSADRASNNNAPHHFNASPRPGNNTNTQDFERPQRDDHELDGKNVCLPGNDQSNSNYGPGARSRHNAELYAQRKGGEQNRREHHSSRQESKKSAQPRHPERFWQSDVPSASNDNIKDSSYQLERTGSAIVVPVEAVDPQSLYRVGRTNNVVATAELTDIRSQHQQCNSEDSHHRAERKNRAIVQELPSEPNDIRRQHRQHKNYQKKEIEHDSNGENRLFGFEHITKQVLSFPDDSSSILEAGKVRQSESSSRIKSRGQARKQKSRNTRSNCPSFGDETGQLDESATHRDRLIEQLWKGDYECMVCCERVRVRDSIWSCTGCFHVFHLSCVYKWACSPAAVIENEGWRCPACQQTTSALPNHYYCFCGKTEKPEWNPYEVPHSCGSVCGKNRDKGDCDHHCTLLCHPGPCPSCSVSLRKACQCGSTFQYIRCGQTTPVLCDNVCSKILNCGLHMCERKCHEGQCPDCDQVLKQACFCGKDTRIVKCTSETSGVEFYSCGSICEGVLSCSEHTCKQQCHPGDCLPCDLLPQVVTHCPCGKTPLSEFEKSKGLRPRQKCTDPVPTCGSVCNLPLSCGPENNRHVCLSICHQPPCPPCPSKTVLKCRCDGQSKEFPCESLANIGEFLCERRCNKKKTCGRHKCLNECCIETSHPCTLVCNRKLSCGLHFCQERCHNGKCPPCWNVSFEDLTCHCGSAVIYAPIRCGTRPPECNQPCAREHPCSHPVQHTCHSDEKCPPCTFLMEKWCFGEHELRANVPCHLAGLSCGKVCNKLLPCGLHTCQLVCHRGSCTKEGDVCTQPCKKERPDCGHDCGLPCHDGPCPESVCKALISVTCSCGQRSENILCGENSRLYNQVSAPLLASKMQLIQSGQCVDISDVLSSAKTNKHGKLECNEKCILIERNRRLAIALQIRNPDLSNKPGPPNYSDFLIDETKKNLPFVTSVFEQLSKLVQDAKKGKLKLRTFSFQPMNREHRRVIHELAEYFGCKTESMDMEPKRSVEVTAFRDKSWLPSVSVMTVVQRNMGQRKGPIPVVSVEKKKESTDLPSTSSAKEEEKEVIDYFDFS